MRRQVPCCFLFALLFLPVAAVEMELAPIFTDRMVVAAGKPVRIFGTGDGEAVVSMNDAVVKVRSYGGRWCATLQPIPAGGPYEIRVALNGRERMLRDVLAGEVLVMAGQSNMQFHLKESETVSTNWVSDANIRQFMTTTIEGKERFLAKDGWVGLDRATAGDWSALAYETAVRRARARKIPIGIIHCFQGASAIKAWLPKTLALDPRLMLPPELRVHDDSRSDYTDPFNKSGTLYERQFSEIGPFAVSAVVWYQGESNTGSVEEGRLYADMLAALIGQWRLDFGDARLPFVVVQIAAYPYEGDPKAWCKRDAWAAVQMSQRQIAKIVPHVTSVRSEDVCDADKGIHPPTKWRLAERIADAIGFED